MKRRRKKRIVKRHSFKTYRKQRALNFSYLKEWVKAPSRAEEGLEDTTAMLIGRAVHVLVLEGLTKFLNLFEVMRVSTRGTKAYKELAAQSQKGILLQSEWEMIQGIREAIKSHTMARSLLMHGHRECSAYWSEQFGEDWLGMKCRIDSLQPNRKLIVDLKTTTDASPDQFPREIAKYGYARQMAFYQRGMHQITGDWFAPILVAVEKKAPHLIGIYSLDSDSMQLCRDWLQDKLEKYHTWMKEPKSKRTMGYDPRIFEVRLPQWAFYE